MRMVDLMAFCNVLVVSKCPKCVVVCGYLSVKIRSDSGSRSMPMNRPNGDALMVERANVAAAHPPAAPHPM